ncbi:MAG: ATP-binding protein [Methanomassiliicoccales archaeon]|nr:ATP-binding protein [Methanomassiliicoccales archaeon]
MLFSSLSPDGYSIVYEDDGVGVNENEKEKIFQKGYGKDSGMGLYLCVQILNITGLRIRENGEYLKGARFEINVPNGKWR